MGGGTDLRSYGCCDRLFGEYEANVPTFHFFFQIGAQLQGGKTGLEPSGRAWEGVDFWKRLPAGRPAPVDRISSLWVGSGCQELRDRRASLTVQQPTHTF